MRISRNFNNPSPINFHKAPNSGPASGKDDANRTEYFHKPGETALTQDGEKDYEAIMEIMNPGYKARQEAMLKDLADKIKKRGGLSNNTANNDPDSISMDNSKKNRKI